MAAVANPPVGRVINIARGKTVPLSEVIDIVRRTTGAPLVATHGASEKGDVRTTSADISLARALLRYEPTTDLAQGIASQWAHVRSDPATAPAPGAPVKQG